MKDKEFESLHPVYSHRNIMAAFLGKDYDVTVNLQFDADDEKSIPVFDIIVAGCEHKAEAMRQILNGEFPLSNYNCKLLVNGKGKSHKNFVTPVMVETAFAGNPLFSKLHIKRNDDGNIDKWAILLKQEAVVIANDQANSPSGTECHSAEDLCRMVLHGKMDSVMMYGTDIGKDNGYWERHLG